MRYLPCVAGKHSLPILGHIAPRGPEAAGNPKIVETRFFVAYLMPSDSDEV